MSRAALNAAVAAACALALGASLAAAPPNPHMDPSLTTGGCRSCHRGHGVSRSPMLPDTQAKVCLSCHGTGADVARATANGLVAAGARPPLVTDAFTQPYTHFLSGNARSRHEASAVTCSSCHAPHRGSPAAPGSAGTRKPSLRDPAGFESELCEGCHGSQGARTQNLKDIGRQFAPQNRSFHPIEMPAVERSASLAPALQGKFVNCTDCHGNGDAKGSRGVHGSPYPFLLLAQYTTTDGAVETQAVYALCYACHDRDKLLKRGLAIHRSHVVTARGSCATCHDAHGSVGNRALIRFGEETFISGVTPSSSGKLAFVSVGPGSGSCYLTCHGVNHDPLSYGSSGPPAVPPPSR